MFWGCLSGAGKGPHLFWEKAWGPATPQTYMNHVVPMLHEWTATHPAHTLMHDGAPGQRGGATLADLQQRGVDPVEWPPYSPDLNPLDRVWQGMKNHLQEKYPPNMPHDQLRGALEDAWALVGERALADFLGSLPKRLQAVIDAGGLLTKY